MEYLWITVIVVLTAIITWLMSQSFASKKLYTLRLKETETAGELKNLREISTRLQQENKEKQQKFQEQLEELKTHHTSHITEIKEEWRTRILELENKHQEEQNKAKEEAKDQHLRNAKKEEDLLQRHADHVKQLKEEHEQRIQKRQDEWQHQFDAQKDELKKLKDQFYSDFRSISLKILKEQEEDMQNRNDYNIRKVMQPFQVEIEQFRKRVDATHTEAVKGQSRLFEQIKNLTQINQTLTDQANNLTQALKGNNKIQGNWGEMVLIRHLEACGFIENVNFTTQVDSRDGQGNRKILDVLLHLPNNRFVVIDAKVNLIHYQHYIQSQGEDLESLSSHLTSMKKQLKSLSGKSYHEITDEFSPDFVLMYVPIEMAWQVAVSHDSDLLHEGYKKRVLLVGPSTLLPTLKLIHMIWQVDKQNKNAQEIAERGGKLYDKFYSVQQSLYKMASYLQNLNNSFNDMNKQVHEGSGNLLRQVEMLKELGAATKKNLKSESGKLMITNERLNNQDLE